MKQYAKKLFSLVVLCSTTSVMLQADCDNNKGNNVLPFIQWRSQGRDMARKLYGTTSYAVYQDDMDSVYGTFNIDLQYDQTFRGNRLAECLFGASLVSNTASTTTNDCNKCDDVLVISGLGSNGLGTGRAATEWMAENFMLPRDFKSTISFSPKIQDVVVDFNLYVGLDRWVKGMYFRLYGPFAWNKADLRANENVLTPGTAGYPQGYFNNDGSVPATSLFQSALNYFGGCQLPKFNDQNVVVQPLKFAKFSDCNLSSSSSNNCNDSCNNANTKTGFAELRGEFGWNYLQEKYRLLLNIQAAAPTGSRPNGEYLFPAYVGNGKHWELGVGLGGAWKMWGSEDGDKSFNFIVEADITHLFNAKQTLTFDLKNKPNSRYMLAQQLGTPAGAFVLNTNTAVFGTPDGDGGVYAPVANFSTREAKVSFGVQADVVAMFNYTVRGFSWDLGYNFWALSSSNICLSDNCNDSCPAIAAFPTDMALKGDASTFGYYADGSVVLGLGATESAATIFTGTNASTTAPLANLGIDTVVTQAAQANPATDLFIAGGTTAAPQTVRINTSSKPIFISIDDLDLEGAEQRGLSHKVFTHFSYTWTDRDKYVPYFGGGFSGEFGGNSGRDCNTTTATTTTSTDCPKSLSCALSKWAVEIKGGVSFH